MVAVPLGLSNYERAAGRTPGILLHNMFVEKDPANQVDGFVRLQRPGLTAFATAGTGPGRAIFRENGVLNGDFIAVSGQLGYRVTGAGLVTELGAIVGTSRCQIAASPTRVLIATGGACYSTDGGILTTVVMPDGLPVQSVAFINGYFILTVAGAQQFYWIAPGQTDPDPLSFASAENSPDNITLCEHINDEIWFFGDGNSTEVWTPTGNMDLPFQRTEGRLYDKGCINRDTCKKLDNTLFWVGTDGIVYRADTVPIRISNNAIEELIEKTDRSELSAWAFPFCGHTFYCLTIGDSGTHVFDVSNQSWGVFSSYGRKEWRASIGAVGQDLSVIAVDSETGQLWKLDSSASTDNGVPIIREMSGMVTVIGAPKACASFSIVAATGWATSTPPGDDPVIDLRWSDDGANTWSDWRPISLGKRGDYAQEVAVTRLGMMRAPGRVFHIRMTENTVFRVSYARVNDWLAA